MSKSVKRLTPQQCQARQIAWVRITGLPPLARAKRKPLQKHANRRRKLLLGCGRARRREEWQ